MSYEDPFVIKERPERFVQLAERLLKEARPRIQESWTLGLPIEDRILGVILEAHIGERPSHNAYRCQAKTVLNSLQKWKDRDGLFDFSHRTEVAADLTVLYMSRPILFSDYRFHLWGQFRKGMFPGDQARRFGEISALILSKYAETVGESQFQYFTSLGQFDRIYEDLDHKIPSFGSRLLRWDLLERLYRHRIFPDDEIDLIPRSLHLADGGAPCEGVAIVLGLGPERRMEIPDLGDKMAVMTVRELSEEKDQAFVWFELESLLCNMQKIETRVHSERYFEGELGFARYWEEMKVHYRNRLDASKKSG